jgi:hypothetical protein
MPDNHWEPVNVDVPFTSTVNIDLWEKDDADPDDYLGTWVARDEELDRGEVTGFFNADDARYELIYVVV